MYVVSWRNRYNQSEHVEFITHLNAAHDRFKELDSRLEVIELTIKERHIKPQDLQDG